MITIDGNVTRWASTAPIDSASPSSVKTRMVPLEAIEPSPYQPRRLFKEAEMQELAASIRAAGLLQPPVVRPLPDGRYQLVMGERRLQACQLLQFATIPVHIQEMTDKEACTAALTENIQRENLTPMEEANAYHYYITHYASTQEEVAAIFGKSRSYIGHLLRLRKLPLSVQQALDEEKISVAHARLLVDEEEAESLLDAIITRNLTVRELTDSLKKQAKRQAMKRHPLNDNHADKAVLERLLHDSLAMPVRISGGNGRHTVSITCASNKELQRLIHAILG